MLARLMSALMISVSLLMFATGANAQTLTPSPTAPVAPTSTSSAIPALTATGTATATDTPGATATPTVSPTISPTPISTAGLTLADLALTVSAYPNPAPARSLVSLFMTVINQGGTVSPATRLRVGVPAGMSIYSTGDGTGAVNCVLSNQTTGQYTNTATGQVYGSYSQCISASGTGAVNCVLSNQTTGQYTNTATGQVYGSYSQCVSASGTGAVNCVLSNQTTGQYTNTATGQIYDSYNQCIAGPGAGSIIGSNCTQIDSSGNLVDCPIPSLLPGASVSFTVPFLVTASSGTVFGVIQLDPDSLVTESNKLNNTVNFSVGVVADAVSPTATPLPAGIPTAIPPIVPTPPVAPQPAGARWLHVLSATQAYSVTMDALWVAAPGEWYFVVREEAGWALAVWEGDTSDWTEWILIDPRVELVISDRAIPELPLWLIVNAATPVYSVTMDPLWVAQPGERYKVRLQESGWALVIWEHDPPDLQEWIQIDNRVVLTRQ